VEVRATVFEKMAEELKHRTICNYMIIPTTPSAVV
jgi:hypothetical protein